MEKIKVYLVDDHHLVRDGFVAILKENATEFTLLGTASNGLELRHNLKELSETPDVVLMDINMPSMNGIEATAYLSENYPEVKVLALTMMKQTTHIKHMLKAGASGYILKDCDKNEFLNALRTVASGKNYFGKSVAQEVMMELTKLKKDAYKKEETLTKRELEVLNLIVQDLSNHQIAEKLNISHRTVDTHKQNILAKTGTNSTAGLVVYAFKHNLVELPS